jgi:hypothetical protein
MFEDEDLLKEQDLKETKVVKKPKLKLSPLFREDMRRKKKSKQNERLQRKLDKLNTEEELNETRNLLNVLSAEEQEMFIYNLAIEKAREHFYTYVKLMAPTLLP